MFPTVINSRKAEGKYISTGGNAMEVSLLGCELTVLSYSTSQGLSFLCFTPNGVLILASLFLILCEFPYTCLYLFKFKLKIVTGLPW